MEVQHQAVIHFVEVIAGNNQDILRSVVVNKVDILKDCVRSPLVPLASGFRRVGRQKKYSAVGVIQIPSRACTNVRVK